MSSLPSHVHAGNTPFSVTFSAPRSVLRLLPRWRTGAEAEVGQADGLCRTHGHCASFPRAECPILLACSPNASSGPPESLALGKPRRAYAVRACTPGAQAPPSPLDACSDQSPTYSGSSGLPRRQPALEPSHCTGNLGCLLRAKDVLREEMHGGASGSHLSAP